MNLNLNNKIVSIEQLIIFLEVIRQGSFLAAAKELQRAQGGVSYNIQTMEEILGLPLFDRSDKRPKLTEAGRAIAKEAQEILNSVQTLLARSSAISQGIEPSFSVTFDIIFPSELQMQMIHKFQKEFDSVELNIRTGILSHCIDDLRQGLSAIAITGVKENGPEFSSVACGRIQFITVCAPHFPLAKKSQVEEKVLKKHRQILLTDNRKESVAVNEFQVFPKVWRVNDVKTRNQLLTEGFGWARVPVHHVSEELKKGLLVETLKRQWVKASLVASLHALFLQSTPQGPVMNWWLKEFEKNRNKPF